MQPWGWGGKTGGRKALDAEQSENIVFNFIFLFHSLRTKASGTQGQKCRYGKSWANHRGLWIQVLCPSLWSL
jgi:hypothetical protein